MADKYKYFKIEAAEILDELTKGLLKLEKTPDDSELVNRLFRYAHTLKGAAAVVRLTVVSKLVHRMEDQLSLFREGKDTPSSENITMLFKFLEAVNAIMEALKEGKAEESADISGILEAPPPEREVRADTSPDLGHLAIPVKTSEVSETSEIVVGKPPSREEITESGHEEQPAEDHNIRIRTREMDRLTDLSNEILINHLRMKDIVLRLRQSIGRFVKSAADLRGPQGFEGPNHHDAFREEFEAATEDLETGLERTRMFSQEMNDLIMAARLMPVKSRAFVFEKIVRDLAVESGKNIKLDIQGRNLLFDRVLLDTISEPVCHLLRNSVDHGMETPDLREKAGKPREGLIELAFAKAGDMARITCLDDGRGMDPDGIRKTAVEKKLVHPGLVGEIPDEEVLYLALLSGFSSAEIVTELSGRGVGLDVLKSCVSGLGGTIRIESEKGRYTCFTISVPFLVNVIDTFMIRVANHNLLIPLKNVVETRRMGTHEIITEAGRNVVIFNDSPVALIEAGGILGIDSGKDGGPFSGDMFKTILIRDNLNMVALAVDDFGGKMEILLKQIEGPLKNNKMLRAATILENGDPAFVLNVGEIFERIKETDLGMTHSFSEEKQVAVLVVDDSFSTSTLISGILMDEGYNVQVARSGEEALKLLPTGEFDLILTDIDMPGISGFELSAKIRKNKRYAETPIVILTSLSSDEDKRRGIEVGANAYIVKGKFDQSTFLETVESLI